MFSKKQNQKRLAIKHFNCRVSLDKLVKHSYANATTVAHVQNTPDIILNALDMMAIKNQVNLNIFAFNFAA